MSGLSRERQEIRKIRYRLKRQGMLELDAWMIRLEPALGTGDPTVTRAIMQMLEGEVPELLAMMHGERSVPVILRPWLEQNICPEKAVGRTFIARVLDSPDGMKKSQSPH